MDIYNILYKLNKYKTKLDNGIGDLELYKKKFNSYLKQTGGVLNEAFILSALGNYQEACYEMIAKNKYTKVLPTVTDIERQKCVKQTAVFTKSILDEAKTQPRDYSQSVGYELGSTYADRAPNPGSNRYADIAPKQGSRYVDPHPVPYRNAYADRAPQPHPHTYAVPHPVSTQNAHAYVDREPHEYAYPALLLANTSPTLGRRNSNSSSKYAKISGIGETSNSPSTSVRVVPV